MKMYIKKMLLLLYLLPISVVANIEKEKKITKLKTLSTVMIGPFIGTYIGIVIINSIDDPPDYLTDLPLLLGTASTITGRYLAGERTIKKSILIGGLSGAGGIGLTFLAKKSGILDTVKSWLIMDKKGYINEESYFRFGIKNKQITPLITLSLGASLTACLTELVIKKLEKHKHEQKEKNVDLGVLNLLKKRTHRI